MLLPTGYAVSPRCVRFYLMSGLYDLAVVVHGKDLKDISTFISQKLATMHQVQSTTTHFVLKRYKQDGFIFDDKERIEGWWLAHD